MKKGTKAAMAVGAAMLTSAMQASGLSSCFYDAKIYADPALKSIPNGGYFTGESQCRDSCHAHWDCNSWTWKAKGDFFKGVLDGGCWVFSGVNPPPLEDVDPSTTPGRVVSGLRVCLGADGGNITGATSEATKAVTSPLPNTSSVVASVPSTEVPPVAEAGNAAAPKDAQASNASMPAVPAATDLPALPTAPPMQIVTAPVAETGNSTVSNTSQASDVSTPSVPAVVDLPALPTAPPVQIVTAAPVEISTSPISEAPISKNATEAPDATNATVVDDANEIATEISGEKSGGSGGFPWWAILLIVIGGAGFLILLGTILAGGKSKAPKKKKKTRSIKTTPSRVEETAAARMEAGRSVAEAAPLLSTNAVEATPVLPTNTVQPTPPQLTVQLPMQPQYAPPAMMLQAPPPIMTQAPPPIMTQGYPYGTQMVRLTQ